ncbi:transporter substrate-binding domain-containing protein [Pseudodesulfovibrio sp. JC047]|uniref:ATP-binding protein n=1 Tax=Pseudodesulfovibrio sp. JC047 TaxID=2683199 RepID=UPI0013D3A1C8|nr:ATP-binding protein [Pseudodesulfovibrio sp. JC047]NDV19847.1 transporter substrate-binding domain-containing protein [Pseudodesulfovibrio sp. JC047]
MKGTCLASCDVSKVSPGDISPGEICALSDVLKNGLADLSPFRYCKPMRFFLYILTCFSFLFFFSCTDALSRPTYKVGIRAISPPFSFLAMQEGVQGVRGCSIDEWVLLGELLDADIEFVLVDSLAEYPRMYAEGRLDLMAHGAPPSSRSSFVFIPLGYSLRNHLFVNSMASVGDDLTELAGKRVVAITGAPYSPQVELGGDVIRVTSPLEALSMLDRGVVEVFVAPSERVADYLIHQNKFSHIEKKGKVLGEIPLGLSVSKYDRQFLADLTAAVRHLRETGSLAQLRDKWFDSASHRDSLAHYAKHIGLAFAVIGLIFVGFVLWNVSLKRRVEKASSDLQRTEQRYRDLIESSPDMIFLVNEAGEILHANERAHSFLFFPRQSAVVNIGQIMVPEDVEEISAFLKKVFNDGCDKLEVGMVSEAGNVMEVEIAGRVIQGPIQTELLACLFARNVTERNRMEEELIQSERLGIIGKMAASVAHEVNNPLGIIQANAEDLLFEPDVSDGVKEGLSAIQRNAIRAGEITKGLLEAASPKPISLEKVNVGDMIDESLSLLGPKVKKSRIRITVQDGPLFIRGDNRVLQQVVVNLVFNSLASMNEHGVIEIMAWRQDLGGLQTVRLEVKDEGRGIPRENLPRIFEPFFTSRKGGFGLGLFITRRMVERHSGLIFAESAVGEGTRMVMEFPAYQEKDMKNA